MLRFETIGRIDMDNLTSLHPLSYRIDFGGEIEVFGKEKKEGEKFKIFKNNSLEEIKSTLESKRSIFIFSLRKGLATITVCRDCNETVPVKNAGRL